MRIAYTHAGNFHADDVFGAALLRIYFKNNIEIKRVVEIPKLNKDDIVFDIGGGKYDHHQKNSELRENNNKYAAFGLLWRDIGQQLVSKEQADNIDEYFIQPLDLSDNFGYENPISEMIASFNPNFMEKDMEINLQFEKAVAIAQQILERIISNAKALDSAKNIVISDLKKSDGEIVILSQNVPWKDILIPSSAKFVIYFSSRGEYSAQVVPVEKGVPTAKVDFPKNWGGLRNEELENVSGIKDLTFCHNDLFLCCGKTKESVLEACKRALSSI